MDFFDYGHACVDLIDPIYPTNAWKDVDKDEIRRLLGEKGDKPWTRLTFPRTLNYATFVHEIDKVSKESM